MNDTQALAYSDYAEYEGFGLPPRAGSKAQPKLRGWRTSPVAHGTRVHRILVTRARRPFLVGTLADYSEGSGYVAMPRAESKKKDAVLRKEFERLVKTWRADTKFTSSVHQMTLHPAYLRIIGMGRPALPLILTELEKRPDHWFAALYAITGANPVPDEDAGRVKRMAKHWLDWARRHGEF